MEKSNVYLDGLKQKLMPYLRDYLEEHNVKVSDHGKFRCINTKHRDSTASCSFYPDTKEQTFYCFGCLPGDELVRCVDSIKKIKDVVIGDKIYTASGEEGKVVNHIEKDGSQKTIYTFTIANIHCEDQQFTEDHEMLVVRDAINKLPYIKVDSERQYGKFSNNLKNKRRTKKYKNKLKIETVLAKDVVPGDYFILPEIRNTILLDSLKNNVCKEYYKGPQNIRIENIPINVDTMWLFGIFCAEGNAYRGGINFSLHSKEVEYANRIKSVIETNFGKNVTIDNRLDRHNSLSVRCSCTDLEHFFRDKFGCGSGNKTAPYDFVRYPLEYQKAFLDGVFDGDADKKRQTLRVTSRNLVLLLQQMVVNLRLPYSINKEDAHVSSYGVNHSDVYILKIFKRENCKCFYETIDGIVYCMQRVDCINPKPSHKIVYDITVLGGGLENTFLSRNYAVHNCGAKGTIVDAAHFLEGKPTTGKEFIHENLFYLANKYKIPYNDKFEITEEEIYRSEVYKAYAEASDIISENQPIEYLNKRKWPVSLCREYGVGCVKSYDDFITRLSNRGFTKEFLRDIDFNSQLFSPNMLIFEVRDEKGRVVGFAGRDMNYVKGGKAFKFRNTSSKCPIYHKSKLLYGLYAAKPSVPPLYVFEGYPDWLTAQKHGLKNSCAIGGTALTYEHINLIKELNIRDIILCLDGDPSGQEKTEKLLDEHFSGEESLRIKIVKMPPDTEECDPDDYLDKYGLDAFRNLPLMDAFEWRLNRFPYDFNKEDVCDRMIPLVVNEPNNIRREGMCKQLSEFSGVRLKAIQRQLDSILNYEEARIKEKENATVRKVMDEVRDTDADPAVIFEMAAENIKKLRSTTSEDLHSNEELTSYLTDIREKFETRSPGLLGFKTEWPMFDEAFSGIPKEDAMITFAGDSNVGKTGLMFELAYRVAKFNEDACVLFMSIDDSRQQALPRVVALAAGLEIRQVTHPNEYVRTDEDRIKLDNGWKEIVALIDDNRFLIKDVSHGTNLTFAENWIKWAKDKFPDKQVIFFLDNFHKLDDDHYKDERIRFKHASGRVHSMKNRLHITAVCTMEIRKLMGGAASKRPMLSDISESKQMEYDNNLIGMVYSDLHARRDSADMIWVEEKNGEKIIKPIVEIDIQKNKVTDFKGTLYYKFSPEHSKFYECPRSEVSEMRSLYKAAVKRFSDKSNPGKPDSNFISSSEVDPW